MSPPTRNRETAQYQGDVVTDSDELEYVDVGIGIKANEPNEAGKREIEIERLQQMLAGTRARVAFHPELSQIIAIRSGDKLKNAAAFDAYPRLRAVVRAGNGTDNVDYEEAARRRIFIMNTPEATRRNVAEVAIDHASGFLKGKTQLNAAFARGEWLRGKVQPREWREVDVGVIGAGGIGQEFLQLAANNGAKHLMFFDTVDEKGDISLDPPNGDTIVARQVDLDTLFDTCDIISIHCGGEEMMAGSDQIERMREGAILVNSSRPENMDYEAALDRVEAGSLFLGADVIPHEKDKQRFTYPINQRLQAAILAGGASISHHIGAESRPGKEGVMDETAALIKATIERGVPHPLPLNLRQSSSIQQSIELPTKPSMNLVVTYGDDQGAHHQITGEMEAAGINFGGAAVFGDGSAGKLATSVLELPIENVTEEQAREAIRRIEGLQGGFHARVLRYA